MPCWHETQTDAHKPKLPNSLKTFIGD